MRISRLDLDGIGSPRRLAERIHEIEELPLEVPLEELCAALDIVSIQTTSTASFEAALLTDALKSSGQILLSDQSPRHRQRFSLAHELGHFLIEAHRPREGAPMECSLGDLFQLNATDKDRRRRIEAQANRFAADLLMPPKRIREFVGREGASLQSLAAMASAFAVSKEAIGRAFVDAHRGPAAMVISRHGNIERLYRAEDFPFIDASIGRPLPSDSLSANTLTPGSFSDIEEVEPDTWLSGRAAQGVLALTEQVLGQSRGYSLTLLLAEIDDEE